MKDEQREYEVKLDPEGGLQALRDIAALEAKGGITISHGAFYYRPKGVVGRLSGRDVGEPRYKLTLMIDSSEGIERLAESMGPKRTVTSL